MLLVPEEHFRVNDNLLIYYSEFNGKDYVNFRKCFLDSDENLCMGKGFNLTIEDFSELCSKTNEMSSYIEKKIKEGL